MRAREHVEPGEFRHRVAFDAPVTTKGASGQRSTDWTPSMTLWADVEPISGRERVVAAAEVAEVDTWIRVRYSRQAAGIAPNWRARFRGVVYDIKAVANVSMADRKIELLAQSGVNQG